ncbi:MAG TPA: hypothetical protein VL126_10260 [Bacteroidota bacterium]|nr:hypothetical protein [Bacteroidota bacterium]
MEQMQIRTSEQNWFLQLAKAYRERIPVLLVDDAKVGIDPAMESLVAMGLKAKLTPREWTAVSVAVGMSAAGAAMVLMAVLDPEPTSKLGLLVGGGALCVLTGGMTAVRILTKMRPPNVQIGPAGVQILWM